MSVRLVCSTYMHCWMSMTLSLLLTVYRSCVFVCIVYGISTLDKSRSLWYCFGISADAASVFRLLVCRSIHRIPILWYWSVNIFWHMHNWMTHTEHTNVLSHIVNWRWMYNMFYRFVYVHYFAGQVSILWLSYDKCQSFITFALHILFHLLGLWS